MNADDSVIHYEWFMHNYENCEKNLTTLLAISFSRLRMFLQC